MEQQQTYQLQTKPKHQLPTLEELHHDLELAGKNDALNAILNTPPPDHWLRVNPFVNVEAIVDGQKKKVGLKYLPIEKVKFLLTRIFQGYEVEVRNIQQLFNSVVVHVRLKVTNPITGEAMYNDGIGAVGVQTNAGASAADMGNIKSDAVMKAAPAAESYAIKDAAEKFGLIFGGNLMKDAIPFAPTYGTAIDWEELGELYEMKKEAMSADEQANAERIINAKETKSYNKLHKQLSSK